MEIDQVQGGFDNLKKVCYFQNAAIFQHDCHMPCICICPRVVVGCTPKNFDGGVRHELLQPNPWLRRPRAKNRMLGYGKWVKIKPLTLGNVTLTTFEAILHAIGQIWPKSCHSLRKNGGIRSKFAENISLAMEDQPKLEHWLRKSSQKIDPWLWKLCSKRHPCGKHTPSKEYRYELQSGNK